MLIGVCQGAIAGMLLAIIYFPIAGFCRAMAKLRHIKGPPAIPFLGNLYDLRGLSWHGWLDSLRKTYGKVFRVLVFNHPLVVILDKKAVREVLTDDTFVKPPSYAENFVPVFGEHGLVTIADGPQHAADRALLNRFFSLPKLLKDLDVLCDIVTTAIDKLLTQDAPHELDVFDFMSHITTDYMSFVIGTLRETRHLHGTLMKAVFTGSRIIGEHWFLNLPGVAWRLKLAGVMAPLEEFNRGINTAFINERRQLYAASPDRCPDDIVTALVSQKPPCSNKVICDHIVTLWCAGSESTSYTLSYAILLLARHPEVQQKLKREVKKVLGKRTHVTPEDYAQLSYATRIMQESLRLYSTIPQISRIAKQPVKLESVGIVIPKGTEVLLPFGLMSRDVEEWGDPIDAFDPDRYLTAGPGGKPIIREAPSKGYFPFSFGKRSCIAGTLVLVEGTVILALLAQRATFHESIRTVRDVATLYQQNYAAHERAVLFINVPPIFTVLWRLIQPFISQGRGNIFMAGKGAETYTLLARYLDPKDIPAEYSGNLVLPRGLDADRDLIPTQARYVELIESLNRAHPDCKEHMPVA